MAHAIFQKFKYICFLITVEPVIVLVLFATMIYQVITQNLYMEKICRVTLKLNISSCDAMSMRNRSGYTIQEEENVQKLTTQWNAIKSFLQGLFCSCLSLFVGSWSDRHSKRKPLILAPAIGEIVSCILLIINTIFLYELPTIFTVLSDSLPSAIVGGWTCIFLGSYSFVASVSSLENKTKRIGAVSTVQSLSFILGIGTSGIIYELLGFVTSYIFCAVLITTGVLIGYFTIKDIQLTHQEVDEERLSEKRKGFFSDFFDIRHFRETFKICFKNSKSERRVKMVVIMILVLILMGCLHGESTVIYLYTRYKFNWDVLEFSIFNFLHFFAQACGNIFALSFLAGYLKFSDIALCMLGLASSAASCLIYSFASKPSYFIVGGIVGCFDFTSHLALRSIMSKIVPSHELGQANSIFGLCEAVSPLIFGPFYSLLYDYTISVFPGTFYLWSILMKICGFGLLMFLHMKSEEIKSPEVENEAMKDLNNQSL